METSQVARILERLQYLINSMIEHGMDEAAEDYTMVRLFIQRREDEFTAWLHTPDNAPEVAACEACGEIEGGHFDGCPEDEHEPDDYELVKDRELGL